MTKNKLILWHRYKDTFLIHTLVVLKTFLSHTVVSHNNITEMSEIILLENSSSPSKLFLIGSLQRLIVIEAEQYPKFLSFLEIGYTK